MTTVDANTLLRQKEAIIDEITEYMNFGAAEDEDDEEYDPGFEAGYEQSHVDRCDSILTEFISSIQSNRGSRIDVLLPDVQLTVKALNQLNSDCEGAILETDQRESICALIDTALRSAGVEPEGDVTEPWREW